MDKEKRHEVRPEISAMNPAYTARILEDVEDGILVISAGGNMLYINKKIRFLLEIEDEENMSLGRMMADNPNPDNDDFYQIILDIAHHQGTHHRRRASFTAPSGKKYYFHITASYVGQPLVKEEEKGLVIAISDETQAHALMMKRRDAMIVLICCIGVLCAWNLAYGVYIFLDKPVMVEWISRLGEVMGVSVLLIALRATSFTLADMGILPLNPKRDIRNSLLISAGVVAVMAIGKMALMAAGSGFFDPAQPFFHWARPGSFWLSYLLIALYQEFIAHCILQENLNRVMPGKRGERWAIFLASAIFLAMHLHLGLVYMIGAALLVLATGCLYNKQHSILGPFLLHYLFGVMAKVMQWT